MKKIPTDLRGENVLVTGGAGFLGSELVKQLTELKANVTVLDNFSSGKIDYIKRCKHVEVIKGDICNEETVSKAMRNQQLVIHLAALPFIPDCYYSPEEFFQVNAIGSVNMMWKAIKSETVKRFVHISSSEVYGTAKYVPMDEEHPTLPHSTYAASKLAGDRAVFTMQKEHDFPTVIVRPFNSYGPNITQPYIIPEIMLQLLHLNGTVRLGNIKSRRDFTYVSDVARGIILASTEKEAIGNTINLGSSSQITIENLAFTIAKSLNKEIRLETEPARFRPYDVESLLCDNTKAKQILGWEPTVPLEEGLKRTIDWGLKNPIFFTGPFKGWYRTNHNANVKAIALALRSQDYV